MTNTDVTDRRQNILERLSAPESARDPYPLYDEIRSSSRAYWDSGARAWVLSGFAHIDTALRSGALLRGPLPRLFGNFEPGSSIDEASSRWLLGLDPPEHTRVRQALMRAISRRLPQVRTYIETAVSALLDELADAGGGDVVTTVARPLPVSVICSLIGVDPADQEVHREKSDALVPLLEPTASAEAKRRASEACQWFLTYFHDLVRARRKQPRDDLVSALLVEVDRGTVTVSDVVSNLILLFGAGHETATSLIGTGFAGLLGSPGQYARLCEGPDMVPSTVDEMLRWDAPIQYVARVAAQDIPVHDVMVGQGDVVVGLLGSGNRDPDRFDAPSEFRVGREDAGSLSFGLGTHYCAGAALAKLQITTLLREVVRRFPGLRFAQEPLGCNAIGMRALSQLTVEV